MSTHIWKPSEEEFVRKNCLILSDTMVAAQLSMMLGKKITYRMVERKRREFGIPKMQGKKPKVNYKKMKGGEANALQQ